MKEARFYPFQEKPEPDSCWSLSAGPDGRIYAASCCEGTPGGGVFIVRYDDAKDRLETVVDVAEAVGVPLKSGRATQCKIHYSFAASPATGLLYAATHLSAPGHGQLGYSPWADWKDEEQSFPGSMLLAWDTGRDAVAWSAPFIPREGCRCLALDEKRGRLYAVSYPRDHFWIYDIEKRRIRDMGRIGSVNSQVVFTDRVGRAYASDGDGRLLRFDPDTDRLVELPVSVPCSPLQNGWHGVLYDLVASPDGECVYGVPWNADPHLFRYWPMEGPHGRMEDLGPVHQERDRTMPIAYYLDHCGGLVFGADGMLYYAASRWQAGDEAGPRAVTDVPTRGVVVRYDPKTGERADAALLQAHPGGQGHYVSRAARDRHGNLFFGQVPRPVPAGLSRLEMGAAGPRRDLHVPVRTWG